MRRPGESQDFCLGSITGSKSNNMREVISIHIGQVRFYFSYALLRAFCLSFLPRKNHPSSNRYRFCSAVTLKDFTTFSFRQSHNAKHSWDAQGSRLYEYDSFVLNCNLYERHKGTCTFPTTVASTVSLHVCLPIQISSSNFP